MPHVALLGAGVSSLACAVELSDRGIECVAYERAARPGGHARTHYTGGFRFDQGPHVVLDVPAAIRPFFDRLDLAMRDCTCPSTIYYGKLGDRFVPAPIQRNISHLPLPARLRCIWDYARARCQKQRSAQTHREALERALGRTLVDLFFEPYSRKRLTYALKDIDVGWTNRVPKPSIEDVLWHGLTSGRVRAGLDSSFRYPPAGIEELPRAITRLLPAAAVAPRSDALQVDVKRNRVVFADGRAIHFEWLVSSIPLPALLDLVRDVPEAVREAAKDLEYGSSYILNFGWNHPLAGPAGIIRFPEPTVCFYRLTFPRSYAPESVPEGSDSVVAEIGYHPIRRHLDPGQALKNAMADLQRVGIVQEGAAPVVEQLLDIPVSHVIHNRRTPRAVQFIIEWLESVGVYTCGKYGRWQELLMPQSMLTGKRAAERIALRAKLGHTHMPSREPERV